MEGSKVLYVSIVDNTCHQFELHVEIESTWSVYWCAANAFIEENLNVE